MANTVFKLRRSSVAGKVPNTSTLSIGELGLNLTDQKLFSSDGSTVFELGANVTNQFVYSTLSVGNSSVNTSVNSTSISVKTIVANGSVGSANQVLTSNGSGIYWSTASSSSSARVYSRTVASASQNTFTTTSSFTTGAIDVYVNGVHLSNTDFTEVNNTTIQLSFNCTSGQIVEIAGYGPQNVSGSVNYTATLNNFIGTGAQTVFSLTTSNVSTQSAFVFINGVLQNPSNAYSISANVITFTAAPSNNDLIEVRIPQFINGNTTNVTAIVGNNTVQFTNTAYVVSNNQTTNAVSQTTIDSYDATLYRSAKYFVQIVDNNANNFQCGEILLTHDNATSYISVYGEIITNTTIATFDTNFVSNNVLLLLTSTSSNTTTKILRTMLTV